jgi:trehalose-6-phosphate synthase
VKWYRPQGPVIIIIEDAVMLYDRLTEKDAQNDSKIIAGHDQSDYLLGIAMKTHIYTEQTI